MNNLAGLGALALPSSFGRALLGGELQLNRQFSVRLQSHRTAAYALRQAYEPQRGCNQSLGVGVGRSLH